MSVASEIEDLNTNLTAAKDAVTTKGGTVGDTGLAGLATEIASIPGGGGGATIFYLNVPDFQEAVSIYKDENCTVIATNMDIHNAFISGGAILKFSNADTPPAEWHKFAAITSSIYIVNNGFTYAEPRLIDYDTKLRWFVDFENHLYLTD